MIVLEPYNHNWQELFYQEKIALVNKLALYKIEIEHIGSTAIPGIYAKPVIDIMIGVDSLFIADEFLIPIIKTLDYEYISIYEQSIPDRRYFNKNLVDNIRTHQIHLVEYKSEFWNRHLLFRDYLRNNPKIAKEYEQLKLFLAKQYTDTNKYAAAKNSFIRKIEQEAIRNK
jgi:GrpB-like predicted nucleotidyltransferase (UPF0157 family)